MAKADEMFTTQELTVMLALSVGMRHKDIEQHLGLAEDIVQQCRINIHDKLGIPTQAELSEFVRRALNNELRRRRLGQGDSGAAMEG